MTAAERAERTREADALCEAAFAKAGCPESGVALVAVGGYGRGELAPYSDLDVVLVMDDAVEVGDWAGLVWYPLWDSGTTIDHSVRTVGEVLEQARADLRVATGMLDVRHLAGDPSLTLQLRTAVLTQWRRDARTRLGELRELVTSRGRTNGELAHASVPDLKESVGGLRDATVLKALVASWLVDVPHGDLERCRVALLDVRDALQTSAGRATDRVVPEYWGDIADALGLPDAQAAQVHTRRLARRLTHLSRLAWRRAEATLREPHPTRKRAPQLQRIAPGVAISFEEVVLDRGAPIGEDPLLLLRCATEAAERDLVLAPTTAARLVREGVALPDPWPAGARDLLVRLLAAGPGLLAVWETLDETGALERVLPEWERVRLLPHASVVHRFTVDRHLVETCIEAARLIRRVARPDVLMVAALLHDIGKGQLTEHCVAGEPIAREIAERIGFDADEVELIGDLVRWHLLLPETATTRDPDDPATVELVTARVRDREELELLAALTEADARATSDKAWTRWRASLVAGLVRRAAAVLADEPVPSDESDELGVPEAVARDASAVSVEVEESGDGSRVTVCSGDRIGLLADAAAMLALQRVSVRAARAWTQDHVGFSVWDVAETGLDAILLRQRLEAIVDRRIDAADRLSRVTPVRLEPTVAVRSDASPTATVIEVRSADRPGLIHTVCATLAAQEISVRSAHVSTLGPQAVDVFYVQEAFAGALSDERASAAAHAVRQALVATYAAPPR
ncbi:UTP--GlnB (protein PII) uridylyltransferase, GlnD [Nocardioides scoriae]|uniref:Bifunctional uridylyltransferase/uridylyl-removing enzyme n=1 Tax=Nocardioides scoriae TaxID=642780 RepID=A0A1H1YFN7_9ACTN|nr:[protein-PII] uridylyltransferase [Nocardioides scoriae]SDT20089.1 UTP--GlnB (protein PII) uridylyltransferase, GlnD [Nocardioides scoriae]